MHGSASSSRSANLMEWAITRVSMKTSILMPVSGCGEDLPLDSPLPQATRGRVCVVALRLEERIESLVIAIASPEVDVVERTSAKRTHQHVVLRAVQMHGHRASDP